jgi:GAF domain-containing protein
MAEVKDYFKTFCRLSQAFGTAATQEDLLVLIVQYAIDTMGGKAACLFLADEKEDFFVPVVQKGLSANYLHANPLKAQRIVNALLKNGYLSFLDATTDPLLENHDAKKAEGIASILTVAVRVQDRTIGVLSLYTSTQRDFTADEIDFLRALAEQGGMAIQKSRLLERIQKNALLFLELTASLNSSLDIKHILNNMTAEVSSALGMKGSDIRLLNQAKNELDLVSSYGLSERFLSDPRVNRSEMTKSALKGNTLVIENVNNNDTFQFIKDLLKQEGIGAMIMAPVKARDDVIGTISLYSQAPRHFSADVKVMIQALAHQGGLAIQNASLYLKLQEDKKDLEADIWSHRSWF